MLETSPKRQQNSPVSPSEQKLFPPLQHLVGLGFINSGFTGRQSPGRERSCGSTEYSNAIPTKKTQQTGAASCLPGGWPEQHWCRDPRPPGKPESAGFNSRARNNRAGWRRLRSTHKSFFPLLESHADSSEFPYQPLMARNEDLDKVVYPSQVLA